MRANEFINEISDEQLERYLARARRQVDARQERMARVRDRLNKGYEIYHADAPSKIVDRFDANTPQEAKRYYDDFITKYESDVDYDLRLRRATGIMEAFDQPYPIKWEKGEHGDYDALATLGDGTYLSIMFNNEGDDEYQIEFHRNNSQAVTGEGDAQRVFATVLKAIQQFLKVEQPWRFIFSASKDVEPGQSSQSRAKLYDRLIQRYAGSWGYDVYHEDHGDQITYELTRKKGLEENFADGIRAYHGNQGGIDTEQLHAPMWFTASRPDAEYYAGNDGYVVVVDLDIQNPYVLQPGEEANSVLRRWQELQAQGYDGIYDRRLGDWIPFSRKQIRVISKDDTFIGENFADGKVKGKSRPGRVKRAGASCAGSVTDLRARARKYGGEKGKMYHWCANMKSGKKKAK